MFGYLVLVHNQTLVVNIDVLFPLVSCSRRDRWPVRFVTFCAFCLYMWYIYIWGGVGWGYQRPDDYVFDSAS